MTAAVTCQCRSLLLLLSLYTLLRTANGYGLDWESLTVSQAETTIRTLTTDVGVTHGIIPVHRFHAAPAGESSELHSAFVHVWARTWQPESATPLEQKRKVLVKGYMFVDDPSMPSKAFEHVAQPEYLKHWLPKVWVFPSLELKQAVQAKVIGDHSRAHSFRPISFELELEISQPCVAVTVTATNNPPDHPEYTMEVCEPLGQELQHCPPLPPFPAGAAVATTQQQHQTQQQHAQAQRQQLVAQQQQRGVPEQVQAPGANVAGSGASSGTTTSELGSVVKTHRALLADNAAASAAGGAAGGGGGVLKTGRTLMADNAAAAGAASGDGNSGIGLLGASQAASVWIVLLPFRSKYGQEFVDDYIQLLWLHTQHHLEQGFAGYIIYTTPMFAKALARSAGIMRLISQRRIRLVSWDSTWQTRLRSLVADQQLVYQHALLALAHCGPSGLHGTTALALIDVDEYFRSAVPGVRLPELWHRCMMPKENTSSISTLTIQRFNIMSSLVPKDKADFPELWVTRTDKDRAKAATTAAGGGPSGSAHARLQRVHQPPYRCHPLRHYDRIEPNGFPAYQRKNIELPAPGAVGYFVHEGMQREGQRAVVVDKECAQLLHIMHMYYPRVKHYTSDHEMFQAFKMWEFEGSAGLKPELSVSEGGCVV